MDRQKREIQNFDKQHAETEKKIEEAVAKMLAPKKKSLARTASGQALSEAAGHLRAQSPSPAPTPVLKPEEEEELPYGVAPKVASSHIHGSITLYEFEAAAGVRGAPALLQSFPSVSFTSIITTGFILEQLDLPLIGVMASPLLPPRCVVEHGVPAHAIRLYGDHRFVCCQCEYKLPNADISHHIVEALLAFAARYHIPMLLSTEGIPSETPGDHLKKVQYLTTSPEFGAAMKKRLYTLVGLRLAALLTAAQVRQGVIAGLTGLILVRRLCLPR